MRSSTAAAVSFLAVVPAAGQEPTVPIVFVSRDVDLEVDRAKRTQAVERARWGKLMVREPDGRLRVLVDGQSPSGEEVPLDVMDPDVSADARRIVFSGFSRREGAFRIYEIGADGKGLRQVTRSDRRVDLSRYGESAALFESYDDLDPCYLPGGRICFVSTRSPGLAPEGRLRVTNLYLVNADGSGLRRITSEKFGADTPVLDPATGRIIFARWWRSALRTKGSASLAPLPPGSPRYGAPVGPPLDPPTERRPLRGIREEEFPGVNHWFLASIHPDGSDLAMYAGAGLDREATHAFRPVARVWGWGEVLALFLPRTPLLGVPAQGGLRSLEKGFSRPQLLDGPRRFFSEEEPGFSPWQNLYAGVADLPAGRVFSVRVPGRNDYDLHHEAFGRLSSTPLLWLAGSSELDPVALVERRLPPALPERTSEAPPEDPPRDMAEAFAQGGSFTFLSENLHFNPGLNVALPHSPPVAAPFLIHRAEIQPGGRVEAELPAGVPLFELLRRADGTVAVGRDGQIFHVGGFNFGSRGQTARCVGCHAGHTLQEVPPEPAWTNVAPSAVVTTSPSLVLPAWDTWIRLSPEALVDRRTEGLVSEWAGGDSRRMAIIELRWKVPIQAREIVFHAPLPGPTRDQVIMSYYLELHLTSGGSRDARIHEPIVPGGTRLYVGAEFDRLTMGIDSRDVDGPYEGQYLPALAEVEVFGRAAAGPFPSRALFLRGDANCDLQVGLSDAVAILDSLFLGRGPLCCQAAADPNGDAKLDLSDCVYLLGHLFLGGSPPGQPFPACGSAAEGGLPCDRDGCREEFDF
jgi:hypothetical protein